MSLSAANLRAQILVTFHFCVVHHGRVVIGLETSWRFKDLGARKRAKHISQGSSMLSSSPSIIIFVTPLFLRRYDCHGRTELQSLLSSCVAQCSANTVSMPRSCSAGGGGICVNTLKKTFRQGATGSATEEGHVVLVCIGTGHSSNQLIVSIVVVH